MTEEAANGNSKTALGEKRPSALPAAREPLIGTLLSGRYLIGRLLGEGGMGAVYEAEHTLMHKRLAVKVLHAELSRNTEVVARFEREAMASAHIDHPNVALATDFGKLDDGSFFLVLEFVEGKSLRAVIEEGRLEVGRALHILAQIAAPLVRAHKMGIVHRDLKPENVMLTLRDGDPDFVKVLDFGIAKLPAGEFAADEAPKGSAAKTKLTKVGMIYGTPEYMAPEQALGGVIDGRADLYALGCIAYEMLTGVRPFDADEPVAIITMHITAPVPPMAMKAPDAAIPEEVESLVRRMLVKEVAGRPADAKELVNATVALLAELVAAGRIDTRHVPAPFSSRASLESVHTVVPGAGAKVFTAPMHVTEYAPFGVTPTEIGRHVKAGIANVRRLNPRAIGILGGALGAILLVVFLVARSPSRKGSGAPLVGDSELGAGSAAPAQIEDTLEQDIVKASLRLEKGDVAGAIDALVVLEATHMDSARVHRALERAYTAAHRPKDAMREAQLWLEKDPAAATDVQLGTDVRNAAIEAETADDAFALLETSMGAIGADHLYDAGYGSFARQYPKAAERARRSLGKPDVRANASPNLSVTLALKGAATCDAKKALLTSAGEVGDVRTLAVLKPLSATSGCGFLSARDCWPCLHKDGSLARAITAIEARGR